MSDATPLVVREYVASDGTIPFRDWLTALDVASRARIQARVTRLETGNLGDRKRVGAGVWEARVMFGPGHRIYFGREGRNIILLLLGGDKSSQAADIRNAQAFWGAYQEVTRRGTKK